MIEPHLLRETHSTDQNLNSLKLRRLRTHNVGAHPQGRREVGRLSPMLVETLSVLRQLILIGAEKGGILVHKSRLFHQLEKGRPDEAQRKSNSIAREASVYNECTVGSSLCQCSTLWIVKMT